MGTLILTVALVCATPAWAATEWVRGEVIKLDPERSRVTLKHAPIQIAKMAAMTMRFKVRDADSLALLKVGDKVRFEVAEHDSELVVQRIEVSR